MEITYFGHSCFKIQGRDLSVVTDPFDTAKTGYKNIRTTADVVTISHNHYDHDCISGISGNPMVFDSPGEYEIKDCDFEGVASEHGGTEENKKAGNTIFVFEIDEIKLCHLGDLGRELTAQELEKIDGVDILFVPVGGTFTVGPEGAAKVISQVEPKIAIPMHYKTKDSKISELQSLDKFLHEMGSEMKPLPRLKIAKKDLPEEMEIVVLES
ncbi:MAG: MBL fold metallo-hydrolase [Patescibacteria group bacterium]|nr:MBL fold metallo-hydrolase [Patescibacteria group bacterium]